MENETLSLYTFMCIILRVQAGTPVIVHLHLINLYHKFKMAIVSYQLSYLM